MLTNKNKKHQEGFTFVELAVVLVIIGFIIAAIYGGLALVKQASIRSIITDFQNYKTAYTNFVVKYNGVPGDLNRANIFWPDTSGGSASCGTTAALCNGDGDELIESTNAEGRKAWRHLALSTFANTGAPAMTASNGTIVLVPDTMPPSAGASPNGGYIMSGYNSNGGIFDLSTLVSPWYASGLPIDKNKNSVYIGKVNNSAGDTNNGLSLGILNPEDAFIIDQKIDDGIVTSSNTFTGASTGTIRTINDGTVASGINDCIVSGSYQAGNTTSKTVTKCIVGYQLN